MYRKVLPMWIFLSFAFFSVFAADVAHGAPAGTFDARSYGLRGNYLIAGEAKGVLEAGGKTAVVRLIAQRDRGETFNKEFLLEVRPAEGKPFLVRLPDNAGGFDPKMELRPFVKRGKSEIFLAIQTGGSGGIVRFLVVEVKKRQGKVVYDSDATPLPTFYGKFLDGYKARVDVKETETHVTLDLVPRKSLYDKDGVYDPETGRVIKPTDVWGGGYGLIQAMDVDGDGLYELRGIVELSGAYHADRVAGVESVLKCVEGVWQVQSSRITPASDLKILSEM